MDSSSGSPPGTGRVNGEGKQDLPANLALSVMIPSLHECSNILNSSVQVGGIAGSAAILGGAFVGIVVSPSPLAFAIASGIQYSAMGFSFNALRSLSIGANERHKQRISTPKERIIASSIAGAACGPIASLFNRRRWMLPSILMFGLFGATGQYVYNRIDAQELTPNTEDAKGNFLWMNSKWSPVKVLTDAEYETMLREKLLNVNAQIALVDESIEDLRAQEREMAGVSIKGNEETKPK
ncbi:hypothetical protein BGZ60DRAFT_526945 [Tricladium varicosporioides]|nr:hypothetical protein BGZ60DRAFT_526945 [Hymenoscyphus varicosporioides]